MNVRLLIDGGSFTRTKMGTVSASIWFEAETTCFPARGWRDLAPAFVRYWFEGLARRASGASRKTVRFMDGPYRVQLWVVGRQHLEMRFIRDESDKDNLLFSPRAEIWTVLGAATRPGEQLLTVYGTMNGADADEAAIGESIGRAAEILPMA